MVIPEGSLYVNLVIFIVSLSFCALFSFLETSMMAMRLFQLKELAQKAGRYQQLFKAIEEDPNRLLNTILVAYNLVNIIVATTGELVVTELLPESLPSSVRYTLSVCILTGAVTIIGDILPKNIVKLRGEKYFASTLWLTNLAYYLLYPFVTLLSLFTDMVARLFFGKSTTEEDPVTSEREIQFLIGYIDEKGLMDRDKTNMLQSIFRLSTTSVREIMVPGPEIVMIDISKSVQDAYQMFIKYQFSRLPVYKGDMNNVVGMLHFKDLIPVLTKSIERPLRELMRPILFIPESTKVNQLLREFKSKHMHIAMVIDEHGGVAGLATLEDVIEEIVGEIHDEYEAISERIVLVGKGKWLVDGRAELDKLAALLKISFQTEAAVTTIGGFLTEQFQRLPQKGDKLSYQGYTFQVQKVTSKRVVQALIFAGDKKEQLPAEQK
ncbi:MAG: HlyC/CorC family transporter [Candidatus Babeliaceae bacterium]|nr:HlyC/CorC family transporter [Candidatus Babeliaceae bacterium]